MIIMGPNKDRGGMVAEIMEKMKSSEGSYEKLKSQNEQMSHSSKDERHESVDAAANEIMDALRQSDVSKFQNALKSFIQICMKEM